MNWNLEGYCSSLGISVGAESTSAFILASSAVVDSSRSLYVEVTSKSPIFRKLACLSCAARISLNSALEKMEPIGMFSSQCSSSSAKSFFGIEKRDSSLAHLEMIVFQYSPIGTFDSVE